MTRPDAGVVWAAQRPLTDGQFEVATSWGNVLTGNRSGVEHGDGDFVVRADKDGKPNLDDPWIVNKCVFRRTYQRA